LKTGTTDLAGRCLVATATRDGRTMVVVELDAPNIYATATELLDRGFSIPPSEEAAMEHLPSVVPDAALTPQPTTTIEQTAAPAAATVRGTKPSSGLDLNSPMVAILVALLGGLPLLLLVRRRGQRREAMAAAARQPPDQDAAHPPRTPVG
jgi:D-alanyl-D-alanine carboxypeptidase